MAINYKRDIEIENRLTKVEAGLGSVKKDTSTILTNHLPHINRKLNWLMLIVVTLAAESKFDILSLLRGIF